MKLTKIFNKIIAFVSIIIILITSYYIYQVVIQKKEYGTIMGYTIFRIATGSMEPAIKVGNKIIVKLTKDVNQNDIIVYSKGDTIICHRVEKINEKSIICKGDSNSVEDDEISKNTIIGKVIYIF